MFLPVFCNLEGADAVCDRKKVWVSPQSQFHVGRLLIMIFDGLSYPAVVLADLGI